MNYSAHKTGLDRIARDIGDAVSAAFAAMVADIRAGVEARVAVDRAFESYSGRYVEDFRAAMNARLGNKAISAPRARRIGLSPSLYDNAAQTRREVARLVREHSKGWNDAQRLALDLYDGYGSSRKPVLRAQNALPQYLGDAFSDDAVFRSAWTGSSTALQEIASNQATGKPLAKVLARIKSANLRTPALRAAYLQAIEALEKGAGQKQLARALKTAWEEKHRYFANRIAQTELHRAWSDRQAEDIRTDAEVEVVQIRLSATHPVEDVCDFHARADLYGIGPGKYPKELAPKPPFHPFCRCRLVKVYGDDATRLRAIPGADLAFLRSLPEAEQVKVMGSRDRLNDALSGAKVFDVLNSVNGTGHKVRRIG
jgi:hypothetical protein